MLKKKQQQLNTETATFEDLLNFISDSGYTVMFGKTDLSNDFRDVPYIELQKGDKCFRSMCGNSFRRSLECAVIDVIENKIP